MSDGQTSIETEIEIINEQGLHTRPVMRLVDLASQFRCDIRMSKGERSADVRSPWEMMLLEAPKGTRLKLSITGEDAQAALDAIIRLVAEKFNED